MLWFFLSMKQFMVPKSVFVSVFKYHVHVSPYLHFMETCLAPPHQQSGATLTREQQKILQD